MASVQPGEKYKIISVFDHLVLDVKGDKVENNNAVIPYSWHAGDNQIFTFKVKDTGFVAFPQRQVSGQDKPFVLDESQTVKGHLITFKEHDGKNQKLIIEPIKKHAFVCFLKSGYSNNVLQNNGGTLTFEPRSDTNVRQRWVLAEWGSKAEPFIPDPPKPDPIIEVIPVPDKNNDPVVPPKPKPDPPKPDPANIDQSYTEV